MAKKNDLVVAKESSPNIVPYLFSLDKITKPRCKICNHEHREEMEEIYENQKRINYLAIKNKLKDDYDFDIATNNIKNHMLYHYKAMQNNEALQDYADDVQCWVDMQTNKVAALKARTAILEREMFTIAQSSEGLDIIERRKNAEIIKKLAETILTYEGKLCEYQEEVKPVTLVFNQLQVIVRDELEHVDSINTKKVVSTILSRLHDSVGSMIIE